MYLYFWPPTISLFHSEAGLISKDVLADNLSPNTADTMSWFGTTFPSMTLTGVIQVYTLSCIFKPIVGSNNFLGFFRPGEIVVLVCPATIQTGRSFESC